MAKRFLDGCLMPASRAHVHWNGTFSDSEKAKLVRPPLPPALVDVLQELSSQGNSLNAYLRFDQKWYLPDDILAKVDRMSMAHSIEIRPPFLDHRIVEFAASLPDQLKVQGAAQKIVLRELMKRKLPVSTLRRKKVGFDFPAHEWLRGPLRDLLRDTLVSGAADDLFYRETLEGAVRDHLNRRVNIGYHLWGLLLLLLWMKRWRIQTTHLFENRRPKHASSVSSI
jgi:asparagine synthase (glutamine-hydrolysing)